MRLDRPAGGSDRPRDGRDRADRPRETGSLYAPGNFDVKPPPTKEEIKFERLRARGEVAFRYGKWVKCEPPPHVKFQDRIDRMTEVRLPETIRELPKARDTIPVDRWNWTEADVGKFSEYGMNPDHPQNRGKAEGYEVIGYKIRDPRDRLDSAWDMVEVTRRILPDAHVVTVKDTSYGVMKFHAVNGIIGPNGRAATYDSCWMVDQRGDGLKTARLITSWVRPHKEKREGEG